MSQSAQGLGSSLVFFALNAAGVPPGPALPGPVLVQVLGDLGLGEGAARTAILRMRKAGWLRSSRAGRSVGYAPSEAIVAGFRRRAQHPAEAPEWDSRFHALIVAVPESQRAFRDALRRAAALAGYRTLHPGLLIAPADRRAEIAPVLDRMPKGASVLSASLELSHADSAMVASQLWDLEALARHYRALADASREATAAARRRVPAGAEAIRALATATFPIFEAFRDDPGLPPQLLPPDWPLGELRQALGDALECLGPAARTYIDTLRSR